MNQRPIDQLVEKGKQRADWFEPDAEVILASTAKMLLFQLEAECRKITEPTTNQRPIEIEEVVANMPRIKCKTCNGDGCDIGVDMYGEPEQIQCGDCHAEGTYTTLDCVRTLLQEECSQTDERLREVVDAWRIEGVNPEYHREQKRLLARNWPTLFRAINNIDITPNTPQV
jgi:hypothetical protein